MIDAVPPRLDFQHDLSKLFLVLFRPSLGTSQYFSKLMVIELS